MVVVVVAVVVAVVVVVVYGVAFDRVIVTKATSKSNFLFVILSLSFVIENDFNNIVIHLTRHVSNIFMSNSLDALIMESSAKSRVVW